MGKLEKWVPVIGYDGLYDVSDLGRVRSAINRKNSFIGKLLSSGKSNNSYLTVCLYKKGKRHSFAVHRLVMLSFIGPCPDNHEVNHISGDKNNNCLKNLEYITPSENRLHSFAIGLESNKGENHSQNKLTEKNVHEIRLRLIKGETQKSIASSFHVAAPTISSISTRRNWGWLK